MLGERLKELREDLELNQEDIARALNIGRSTYGNYETERAEPSINVLIDLSNFYKVSIDYICGNTDIKHNFYKDKKLCKYINKCIEIYKELFS